MKRFLLTFALCSWSVSAAVVLDSPYNEVATWAKVAIHVHSLISPSPDPGGNHPLSDVCKWLGDTNNFAAYIITEHDQLSTNAVPPFASGLFIQGQEVTRTNHTIGMFLTNLVAGGYPNQSNGEPQTVINDIVSQGGLAGLAHPNYAAAPWLTNVALTMTNFQFMEVNNTVVEDALGSQGLAENVWDFILTAGRRVFGYGGLDMHIAFTTNTMNQVFVAATNEAAIKAAMTQGNMVFGRNATMRVSRSNLTLFADSYGVNSRFEWVGMRGSILKTLTSGTVDSYRCAGSETYVRVRAIPVGSTNNDIAYSQPTWVTSVTDQIRTRRTPRRR